MYIYVRTLVQTRSLLTSSRVRLVRGPAKRRFRTPAAMEVCSQFSGETLAVLDPTEFEGQSVMSMKQSLTTVAGVSRFRQRLFLEDGSQLQDDEILETVPAKVKLVVLDFCPPDPEQTRQMMQACSDNDLIALERLLRSALQPKVTNKHGETPLHVAAARGRIESARLLVEADPCKDQATHIGATPMFVAAANGHLDVVRFLVEVGAVTDQAMYNGAAPIFAAAQMGHLDVVRFLAEVGAVTDQAMYNGATPIFAAAANGHVDVVRFLAEVGAQKDQAENNGATPMFVAAQNGHVDVVRFLAEVGAVTDQAMYNGATAMYAAAANGHVDVVRFLSEVGAQKDQANNSGATPM